MEQNIIIENKIIDWIALDAEGRFTAVLSEGDLEIKKRSEYKDEKEIYFRIVGSERPKKSFILQKDILKINKPEKNFYYLFAFYNKVLHGIGDHVWVVPYHDLKIIFEDIKKSEVEIKEDDFKLDKFIKKEKDFIIFLTDKMIKK